MKRLLFCCLLLACTAAAFAQKAQKKAIEQARTFVKSGKNLDKAESLMTNLLKDSANQENEKIWLTLLEAVKKQYDQGNEKLYLKQKYDTASLFTVTRKLFLICEGFDSIEARPDAKGRVKLNYRARHAAMLNGLMPNLFSGGAFFLRRADFKNSWAFYDTYLDCARQPIFDSYPLVKRDSLAPTAAYWALYSGYRLSDYDKVMKYQAMAERDSTRLENVLQYVATTHLLKGDTAKYVQTLKRGFECSPTNRFFFPRIVDYYNSRLLADSARAFIDSAIASDSTNGLFLFAKSSALLNAGEYEECIHVTERLLAVDDSLAEAHCNMGLAYYNQAVELERTMKRTRKKKEAVNELYRKSLPYMETFRKMAPEQQTKWVPALYAIYLNLNMGREFEEIDKMREALKQ